MTTCPFRNYECNKECAMYISPEELNEYVISKLSSIGVFKRGEGMCAFKHIGLTAGRFIFENTVTNPKRF